MCEVMYTFRWSNCSEWQRTFKEIYFFYNLGIVLSINGIYLKSVQCICYIAGSNLAAHSTISNNLAESFILYNYVNKM